METDRSQKKRQGDTEAGRKGEKLTNESPCLPVSLSNFLLRFDNRPAGVLPAVRANYVGRLHRATLRTGLQLLHLQRVVGATHAGPRIGMFAFGYGHGDTCRIDSMLSGWEESTSLSARPWPRQGRELRCSRAARLCGTYQWKFGCRRNPRQSAGSLICS
jgi:hypothetical protein